MTFNWEKLGIIFDPKDVKNRDWLFEFAQAPTALIFDNFIRVYFACRPKPDSKKQYVSYLGYVDLNRYNLKEVLKVSENPIFNLGELGSFDEHGTYPASMIKRENDIIAYYAGWSRCESVPFNISIGAAISKDNGHTFTKIGKGPLLSFCPEEPFIVAGPKIRKFNNKWYLFYIAGIKWLKREDGSPEIVNKIRYATSKDGFKWNRNHKDIIPNKVEENECQASPDVFYHNGIYHMFFCYRYSLNFRGKEFGYRIGYAYSKDLENWTRDDRKAGLDVSENGFDSEMVAYPHVFELDNEIYMFYLGNGVGRHGFALAKLNKSK